MPRKEDAHFVKFPPINLKTNVTEKSNFNSGSIVASPRNSLTNSRRNSMYRRVSISQNVEQIPSSSINYNKAESDILKECVPLLSLARFSCELSIEARFAIFKGYEKLLLGELEKKFPEYSNLINKSSNTGSNLISNVTLNKETVKLKTLQYDKEFQILSSSKAKKKKSHSSNQYSETTDSTSNDYEERDIQNKARLLMSRYLQFAHVILDSLKPTQVVRSSNYAGKLSQNNFNTIQGWNWWNTTWQECFASKNVN